MLDEFTVAGGERYEVPERPGIDQKDTSPTTAYQVSSCGMAMSRRKGSEGCKPGDPCAERRSMSLGRWLEECAKKKLTKKFKR